MNKPIDITGVTLRTPRLILRPWRASDLPDLFEYASVEGVGRMAGWPAHKSPDDSRAVLDSFISEKKVFAIEHQGRAIGSLGIERYNEALYPELDRLMGREIGYVLSRAYWGRGLMPEAVSAAVRWLFEAEALDFILVGHFDWNRQSARVIEKCGFEFIRRTPYETQYGTTETSVDSILYNPDRRRRTDAQEGPHADREPPKEA